jgi:hypothetical protein
MGTNIVSHTLSRVYTHPTKAKYHAEAYAEKMRARGYTVDVIPHEEIEPPYYVVDVIRKK